MLKKIKAHKKIISKKLSMQIPTLHGLLIVLLVSLMGGNVLFALANSIPVPSYSMRVSTTTSLATSSPKVAKDGVVGRATDRVIVKWKNTTALDKRDSVLKGHSSKELREIAGVKAKLVSVPSGKTPEAFIEELKKSDADSIEYVEVDSLVSPSLVPNDPYITSEWHLEKIQATGAWDSSAGAGVVVAVLDTGTDCTHPDLSANCVPGWNIASSTNDTTDSNGHGTMTAGVVAGVGNNALGVTGTAYGAHVMPIKVTNDPAGLAYTSDIANGIIYATDHGAKVVSNSYAVTDSSMVQSATSYLESKGGVFVCSAGNSGGVLTYTNPSSVVTVGATDKSDVITSWSSYGSSTDISAPGAGIYTTLRGGSYGAVSGTSFSAPMTAGILALEFAINPKLTPQQARTILFSSADDLGAPGFDQYYGYGRINAFKAVNQALATLTSTSSNATSTTKDVTAPSAPSRLTLGSVSSSKVTLSWTEATDTVGVVGYNIMRNGVKIGVASSTSYTDITVTASSSYTYTVTAFDLAGNISAPSNQIQVVVPTSTPVQVKIISSQASVKNSTTAVIKWSTNVPTVVSVAYGTSSAQMTQTVATTLFSTSGSLILPSLTSKTVYSYQITATDAQGIKAIGQIGNFTTRAK